MRSFPACRQLDDGKAFGIDLHDFGTTFKAYRREIIQEIQLYGELHRFIPALASSTGARIASAIENRSIGKAEVQLPENWGEPSACSSI